MKGVSTVIATLLMLIITIAIAGLAYSYITTTTSSSTKSALSLDPSSNCTLVGTTRYIGVVIRNDGTSATGASAITLAGTNPAGGAITGSPIACGAAGTSVNAGGTLLCNTAVALTGTIAGTYYVTISGPGSPAAAGPITCQ